MKPRGFGHLGKLKRKSLSTIPVSQVLTTGGQEDLNVGNIRVCLRRAQRLGVVQHSLDFVLITRKVFISWYYLSGPLLGPERDT